MPFLRCLGRWLVLFSALAAPAAIAQVDLRHMRGVHLGSNYGANERGFKRSVFVAPQAIAAANVQVRVSRSTGAFGTWDLAAVTLNNVTLGTQRLAKAGFWLSRNAGTGAISLGFNPSMDSALAGVAGFSGDVDLPRSADGASVDLSQMARTSGVARELIVAVVLNGGRLLETASCEISGGAALDRSAAIESLGLIKASVQAAEGRRNAYFAMLRSMNVEWIALTVPIFNDSIADPTVRVRYRPAGDGGSEVYTFADEDLRDFLLQARQAGFKTVLGFEFYPVILPVSAASPGCGTPAYKPNRWLLGQPAIGAHEPDALCINAAHWWWNPSHASHATNVAAFFRSLSQILVKYAAMARETGVDLFLLGTEQDNLFRTRAGAPPYTNHFLKELTQLVAAVRAEYPGLVSVEQLWTAFAHPDWAASGGGTAQVWNSVFADLGLDVVAVSAYFPLASGPVSRLMSVAEFESAWQQAFTQHLLPLRQRNAGKPIIFSEWGYTSDVNAPFVQGSRLNEPASATGATQQANAMQAFFNVNARHGNLVQGPFVYGVGFPDTAWDCPRVTFTVHCKPAAQTLGDAYGAWMRSDADRMFEWGRKVLPALFSGSFSTGTFEGYYYRYYPATRTYVGVKDGRVFLHDGTQWVLQDVGAMRTFLDQAGQQGQ